MERDTRRQTMAICLIAKYILATFFLLTLRTLSVLSVLSVNKTHVSLTLSALYTMCKQEKQTY